MNNASQRKFALKPLRLITNNQIQVFVLMLTGVTVVMKNRLQSCASI